MKEKLNTICISNYGKKNCRNCNYYDKCYFTLLRKEMRRTRQIVVCNHDLLTAHLHKTRWGGNGLLPDDTPLIVIDEAHNLEDKVRASLTEKYSKSGIISTIEVAANATNKYGSDIDKKISVVRGVLDTVFDEINVQVLCQIENKEEQIDTGKFFLRQTNDVMSQMSHLANLLSDFDETIQRHLGYQNREWTERQDAAVDDLSNLAETFHLFGDTKSNIIWIEKGTDRITSLELCVCPGNIPERINQLYFDSRHVVILTSATLTNQKTGSVEDMYRYLVNNIGFPISENGDTSGLLTEPKLSPFPYEEHAMIYYADDLPHPQKNRDDFILRGSERIVELLKISDGRALILFTSKTDMNAVYSLLKGSDLPYTILKAGDGASQEAVLAKFRAEDTSVLLGTGAFWEGINIIGKALTNVIIFRLPFPVPDPIIDAKCKKAKNPLLDVLTPEMIVNLNQGVGRLIRSESDVGIISIIDPRLADEYNAPYKNIVWDSILIKNRTNDLSILGEFYKSVVNL